MSEDRQVGLMRLIERWQNWSASTPPGRVREDIAESLRDACLGLSDVVVALRSLSPAGYQQVLCRSVETTTHLKISVAGDIHRGLRVWLHVFKPWAETEQRYAASVHNHRYSFVSAMLSGGYVESRWEPAGSGVRESSRHIRRSGEVIVVDAELLHSIDEVLPATSTLVVQLPTQRAFSLVYLPDTARPQRIYDLEEKIASLIQTDQNAS